MAYAERGAWRRSPFAVAWPAALAAGGVFLACGLLAGYVAALPQPLDVRSGDLLGGSIILLPATIVGFVLAIGPTLVGSAALQALARDHEAARLLPVWAGTGALLGSLIALAFGAEDGEVRFALIATSAVCAALCWWRARGCGRGDA